jgi:hypothetical protein
MPAGHTRRAERVDGNGSGSFRETHFGLQERQERGKAT